MAFHLDGSGNNGSNDPIAVGCIRTSAWQCLANKILDKITVVADEADEVALLARITRPASPLVISFINQNVMNLAWRSPDYAACLIDSDILFRDGIGIGCAWRPWDARRVGT